MSSRPADDQSALVQAPSPSEPVSSTAKWGEGFDLIRHGGHELEMLSAKHLVQYLSSVKRAELVEVEVVHTWAPAMFLPLLPAWCLEPSFPACSGRESNIQSIAYGHVEMKGGIHGKKRSRSLGAWKKASLGSWKQA